MDYMGAFTYMFSGRDWIKKIILGAVMGLVPILGPIILIGWTLDVLRNLNQGQPDPLPNWTGDDFARWLGRGLGLTVAILTFLLPVIVIAFIIFMLGNVLTALVGSQVEELGVILGLCMACIGIIVYLLIGLSAQVVLVRFASTDRLDVGLDYLKTFQLVGANIVPLIIIIVLLLVWGVINFILIIVTLGVFALVSPVLTLLILAYFGSQLSQQPGFADRDSS